MEAWEWHVQYSLRCRRRMQEITTTTRSSFLILPPVNRWALSMVGETSIHGLTGASHRVQMKEAMTSSGQEDDAEIRSDRKYPSWLWDSVKVSQSMMKTSCAESIHAATKSNSLSAYKDVKDHFYAIWSKPASSKFYSSLYQHEAL